MIFEFNYTDPCLIHYCAKGRECSINSKGLPDCVCQRYCPYRKKPICGTDGMVYENHCELHRAACILNRPIAFQKIDRCSTLSKNKLKKLENEKHSSTEKPSSQSTTTASTTTTVSSISEQINELESAGKLRPDDVLRLYDNNANEIDVDGKPHTYDQKGYCSSQEYEIMKDNLLLYSHTRLMVQDNNHSKDFLVSIMFSHYDFNNNGKLEEDELNKISIAEHLEDLSNGCALHDMLVFDDSDNDRTLNINEFYQAFNKLYSKS